MRGREEHTQRSPLRVAEQRRPFAPGRVHDRADVVHPRLEIWKAARPIGESGASLVEADETRERSEPLEERRRGGMGPVEPQMEKNPDTRTRSNGPPPVIWYATLTSPLFA